MRKQLLWLMFILSRDKAYIKVSNRVTRSADKIVFKVPSKVSPVYLFFFLFFFFYFRATFQHLLDLPVVVGLQKHFTNNKDNMYTNITI